MENQRRTLIVDRQFQFQLILEVLLITFISINVVVIAIFLLGSGTMVPADTSLLLGVGIASVEIVALLVILWLARSLSNRIAGPVYRVCRTIEAVSNGDLTARVQLRERDHFGEQADNINKALTRIHDRVERLQGLARKLRENPSPDNVTRIERELLDFQTDSNPRAGTEPSGIDSATNPAAEEDPTTGIQKTRGYTLVELLMVLLVISILALIGLPLYLDYSIRTQVSEGFVTVDPVKRALTEYHLETGSFPTDHLHATTAAGVNQPEDYSTPYVSTIEVQPNGVIEIIYDIPALGTRNLLYLEPRSNVAGAFSWVCNDQRPNTLRLKYRPQVCRDP